MPVRLSPQEAYARLRDNPRTILLDVRSTAEFAAGHPAGAYNIPLLDQDPTNGALIPNTDFVEQVSTLFPSTTPIIASCRSGARSFQAGVLLKQAGYADIANLEGGLMGQRDLNGGVAVTGWAQSGLPVSQTPEPGRDYASLLEQIAASMPTDE
ncbi:MAG: hypothetical protein GEEBNDBF_01748 [bacterium]|nr:hypothetical protein [bacterium]